MGLRKGDKVQIGEAEIIVAGAIAHEPDRVSDGFILGPRVLMSLPALEATGLVKPGSLIRWRYRLKMTGSETPKALIRKAKKEYPDAGWRIRNRDRAARGWTGSSSG